MHFSSNLVVIAACLVLVGLVCWPGRGLRAWWLRRRQWLRQTRQEDVLKHLCKCEAAAAKATLASVAGAIGVKESEAAELLREIAASGWLEFSAGAPGLTSEGRAAGMHIIRAHRLWECFLADQTGLAAREWHARAEHREHLMTRAEADALSALLGNPTHDPHGDPIPTADGWMEPDTARPLAALADGEMAVLAHIEDEPAGLYSRLTEIGLRPGMTVRMLGRPDGGVRFTADGEEHTLEPILANQLEVLPLPESDAPGTHLAACAPGEKAVVLGLADGCRGHERRRLLDLGLVAGTEVEVAMTSPSGEPTAYQVRGTLIALHREQARRILVKPVSSRL